MGLSGSEMATATIMKMAIPTKVQATTFQCQTDPMANATVIPTLKES